MEEFLLLIYRVVLENDLDLKEKSDTLSFLEQKKHLCDSRYPSTVATL